MQAEPQSPSTPHKESQKIKFTINDFEVGKIVGEGAYGQVRLAKIKATGDNVAIKSVSRDQITKLGKERHIFREKDLLNEMKHPFIIRLIATCLVRVNLVFLFVYRMMTTCTLCSNTVEMVI